jgi:hypothetical protein
MSSDRGITTLLAKNEGTGPVLAGGAKGPRLSRPSASKEAIDLKQFEGLRAADKRFSLVGLRKSGYCGHVPQYVYFKQELHFDETDKRYTPPKRTVSPKSPRKGAVATPQASRTVSPAKQEAANATQQKESPVRRGSALASGPSQPNSVSRATSVPLRSSNLSPEDLVPKPSREVRLNAAEYYQNPPVLMYPFVEQSHPQAPKQITGFSGHRVGYKFATGSSVNGQRKTELLPKNLEQQLVFPQLGKPAPLPRYPVIRGPVRAGPLGLEMFLTN